MRNSGYETFKRRDLIKDLKSPAAMRGQRGLPSQFSNEVSKGTSSSFLGPQEISKTEDICKMEEIIRRRK